MEDLFTLLPEDIVTDIASRLSAKDACRVKCLSKSWLSLISSDSEFKKKHRFRARQRPAFLVLSRSLPSECVDEGFADGIAFQHIYLNPGTHFAGSCRDLICFLGNSNNIISVYSPSTTQYLCFTTNHKEMCPRVGLVYVTSLNVYKIVVISIVSGNVMHAIGEDRMFKVETLTLHEDGDGRIVGGNYGDHKLTWKPCRSRSVTFRDLGNLIGVNGIVYSIFSPAHDEFKVLSLSFEDDNEKQEQFKIFSLPKVCEHFETWQRSYTLSQVKDVLCYPHISEDSKIDLWLLEDRNTSSWFKGYIINYEVPCPTGWDGRAVGRIVYFPHPTTVCGDNSDEGFFFFHYLGELYQYDICTKKTQKIFRSQYYNHVEAVGVFLDNLVPLKSSLRFTPLPPPKQYRSYDNMLKGTRSLPHVLQPPLPPLHHPIEYQSQPQGPIPPSPLLSTPQFYQSNLLYNSFNSEVKMRTPNTLVPQGSMVPPPPPPPPPPPQFHQLKLQQHTYTSELKMRMQHPPTPQGHIPPPDRFYQHNLQHHPYPQELKMIRPHYPYPQPHYPYAQPPQLFQPPQLPPPCYPHAVYSPEFRMRMPHPPPPQGSLIPPPQPPRYHLHNFQHNLYSPELKNNNRMLHISQPRHDSLRPPQHDIHSPDLKRRKADLSVSLPPIPPPQSPYTLQEEICLKPQPPQYFPQNLQTVMYSPEIMRSAITSGTVPGFSKLPPPPPPPCC